MALSEADQFALRNTGKSAMPRQTELGRLFRETIPDCTLQCGSEIVNLSGEATTVVCQQHPAILVRWQNASA
jgi:hypothetical protein